jgi:N12 class adenine-specific DNA methylase
MEPVEEKHGDMFHLLKMLSEAHAPSKSLSNFCIWAAYWSAVSEETRVNSRLHFALKLGLRSFS